MERFAVEKEEAAGGRLQGMADADADADGDEDREKPVNAFSF